MEQKVYKTQNFKNEWHTLSHIFRNLTNTKKYKYKKSIETNEKTTPMYVIVKLQKTKTKQNLGEAREGKKSTYLFMNRDKNYSELLNRNQVKTVENGVCQLKKKVHPKSWELYFIWSTAEDYIQEAASQLWEAIAKR